MPRPKRPPGKGGASTSRSAKKPHVDHQLSVSDSELECQDDLVAKAFERLEILEGLKGVVRKEGERLRARLDHIREKRHRLREQFSRKRRAIRDKLIEKREDMLELVAEKLNNPKILRRWDTLSFTVGVLSVCATEFIVLQHPSILWMWYIGWILPLIVARFFIYHKTKDHYFMIDFCYFVQYTMILNIIFYPKLPELFMINYALSTGPIMWAVVAWRNSLVFHSLDKITSLALHSLPPLVMYVRRWHTENASSICSRPDCSITFWDPLGGPTLVYLLWQISYFLKTEMVDQDKLREQQDIESSPRWWIRWAERAGGFWRRYANFLGPNNKIFMFMIIQLAFTIVSLLPVYFAFRYQWVNITLLLCVLVVATKNGATFYIEYFSKNYLKNLEEEVLQRQQARARTLSDQDTGEDQPELEPEE